MKKLTAIVSLVLLSGLNANACPFCNRQIMEGIYNSSFYPNLAIMLLAFIVLAIIIAVLTFLSVRSHRKIAAGQSYSGRLLTPVPLTTSALVLGIGLGGFADGIFLHQIFQAHEMLSNKVPATEYIGKSINMFWDGIFHFFCLVTVIIGTVLLWKTIKRKDTDHSGNLLAGGLLAGWGLFNIVEGIIDHHLLKLHNVIELSANHAVGNYTFLALSVLLLAIGYLLISKRKSRTINPNQSFFS